MIGTIIHNRYKIIKKLGIGYHSNVWLAENLFAKTKHPAPVALKLLPKETTSKHIENIIRFKNEALTASRLNHPNINTIHEIGETETLYYIAMDFVDGKSLAELLRNKKGNNAFTIDESIAILIQMCAGLECVHKAGVIHQDIKPANIMLENKKKRVKIIDFGLAKIRDLNQMNDPREIAGTFGYMSPEQIGILKNSVDARSDIYSLGIVFYELLTGVLPFQGIDVHSIIHQHAARIPEPPQKINPAVPEILNAIVLKLLEKDPLKRYQGATGLMFDLMQYQDGQRNFMPGIRDSMTKLSYHTALIGRNKEWQKMQEMLAAIHSGKGNICLISGEAGIGKTRLAEELRKHLYTTSNIPFLYGKCFSGDNKIPYGPLKDAIDHYVKMFDTYSTNRKNEIKNKINNAIGKLSEILHTFNPLLKSLVTVNSPLVALEQERENKRFLMTISSFLYTLSIIEKGLVIVLDDLHWVDEGTLSLLQEIIQQLSAYPLFIVGIYRSDEVDHKHGIKSLIRKSVEKCYPLKIISLTSLEQEDMRDFVSALFQDKQEAIEEISNLLLTKSHGNPFFTIELLKQLIEERAVVCNNNRWEICEENLNEMIIPTTIVDVLIKRISLLCDDEKLCLSYMAVIGKEFDLALLFHIGKDVIARGSIDETRIVEILDKAIDMQLLKRDPELPEKLCFSHDRIREVFYHILHKEERKEFHLRIAKALESIYNGEMEDAVKKDDLVFAIAYHYFEAEVREKILHYAYRAGLQAKEKHADEEAIKYLDIVLLILEGKLLFGDENYRNRWLDCMSTIGEIYVKIGGNEEAIQLYARLLPYISTPTTQAEIYMQVSRAYHKKGDWITCEKYGRKGLALIGERLPDKKIILALDIFMELCKRLLYMVLPQAFLPNEKSPDREKYKMIFWFYYTIGWTYVLSDFFKFIRSVLRVINITTGKIGRSKELGMGIAAYANLLSSTRIPFTVVQRYFNKSIALLEDLHDEWGIAQSVQFLGYATQWKGFYKESIEYFNHSLESFKRIGDIKEVGTSLLGLAHSSHYIADYGTAINCCYQYLEISKKIEDNMGIGSAWNKIANCYIEQGNLDEAFTLVLKNYNSSYDKEIWFLYCIMNKTLAVLYLEKGEIQKALQYIIIARDLCEKNKFLKQYVVQICTVLAEVYIEEFKLLATSLNSREKKQKLKFIKQSCEIAMHKTANWITHYGEALRVMGQYYALISKCSKAEKYFNKSITLCGKLGRKFELGKSLYVYGTWLKKTGKHDMARTQLEHAYNLFKEIDSRLYEKKIVELLHILPNKTVQPVHNYFKKVRDEKVYSLLFQLARDISSNYSLDDMLGKILNAAIEITGAVKGYVAILNENNELDIVLSKNINITQPDAFSTSIIHNTIKSGKPLIASNAAMEENLTAYHSVILHELKSILSVPILYKGTVFGVCYLDNSLAEGIFMEEDLHAMEVLAGQIALIMRDSYMSQNLQKYTDVNPDESFYQEYGITEREKEVIRLALKGFSNKEICEKLSISINTLKSHLKNVNTKTGIKSRLQLIHVIQEHYKAL